jgi:hypothetical protein
MRSVGAVEVGCYRHGHGFSGAIEDKTPSTCINLQLGVFCVLSSVVGF